MNPCRDEPPADIREHDWLWHPDLRRIFQALGGQAEWVRVVGGAVRNTLMGLPVKDVDVATVWTPDVVMARARDCGLKVIPTGIAHGTVTLTGALQAYEVTTLREDIETDGRRARVRFGTDWERDARRRDFTLNAVYAGPEGDLFNPVGGIEDALSGRVRFIGDPDRRIVEDGLRALRFFRLIAELGCGPIDQVALRACARQRTRLARLSAPRMGAEIRRLIVAKQGVKAVQAMQDARLTPQILGHEGDVEKFSRFARLLGRFDISDRVNTFALGFGILAVRDDNDIGRLKARLALRKEEEKWLGVGVRARTWPLPARALEVAHALYRLARHGGCEDAHVAFEFSLLTRWVYEENLELKPTPDGRDPLHETDAGVRMPQTQIEQKYSALMQQARTTPVPRFPVRGRDLLERGVSPGPALGAILKKLEARWCDSDFKLDRAALLATIGDKRG